MLGGELVASPAEQGFVVSARLPMEDSDRRFAPDPAEKPGRPRPAAGRRRCPVTVGVLIADDQPLMRAALRTCLEAEPDLTVVGEAANGVEAVRLAQRLRPDVVVMDVRMPIMDGIEATRQVVALPGGPPARVLVMTTFDIDEYIIDALRAGASGFLVKDSPADEVVRAVRVLASGQALLAPSVTRRLLDLRGKTLPPMPTEARNASLSGITARELDGAEAGRPRPVQPRHRAPDGPGAQQCEDACGPSARQARS